MADPSVVRQPTANPANLHWLNQPMNAGAPEPSWGNPTFGQRTIPNTQVQTGSWNQALQNVAPSGQAKTAEVVGPKQMVGSKFTDFPKLVQQMPQKNPWIGGALQNAGVHAGQRPTPQQFQQYLGQIMGWLQQLMGQMGQGNFTPGHFRQMFQRPGQFDHIARPAEEPNA